MIFLVVAPALAAAPNKDLARVAILTFEDQTGTKNYGYLPQSLTEAVDKSLQSKFEYLREDPVKSEAARRIYPVQGLFTPEQAADFCRKNNFDIVIYGSFTLDRATREVVVSTNVSLGSVQKFRRLKERKNPADATIFSLAEKVADDIVAEMTEVAKSHSGDKKTENETGKIELKKDTITSWDQKKWLISLEAGLAAPLGGNNVRPGGGATLRLNRDLWGRLYTGFDLGGAFTDNKNDRSDSSSNCLSAQCSNNTSNNSSSSFEAVYAAAALGYAFYPGNRWRIFGDFGGGIARGGFSQYSDQSNLQGSTEKSLTKPIIRVAVGIDFLLFQSFSIGIGARLSSFPGSNDSYPYFQPAIRFAYVF